MSERGPVRIQLRRAKDWRIPPGAVIVDRRTKWGNWYRGPDAAAAFDVELTSLHEGRPACIEARVYPPLDEIRAELAGKDLACWCALDTPCHADTLLRLANGGAPVRFIRIEQLIDIHERRAPAIFVDWRCRLCRLTVGALDRTAALDAAATHLRDAHRAHGGQIRRKKK